MPQPALPRDPAPPQSPAHADASPPRPGRPAAVRAYRHAQGGWRRAGAVLSAAFDGFWLGMLSRADLQAVDESFYDGSAQYHTDAYNLGGLFPWEETAVSRYFGAGGRLLLLGAGGGREVVALSRRGYDVEGYECNRALAEFARGLLRRQGLPGRVHDLPRDAVPLAEPASFDGIILGWGAYMLIAGRAHRIALLRRLRPLARPGAPLLISFWTRSGDASHERVSTAIANGIRAALRRERVERGDMLAPNFVHRFVADEVAAELREAGWDPQCFAEHGPGGRDAGWAVGLARDPAPAS